MDTKKKAILFLAVVLLAMGKVLAQYQEKTGTAVVGFKAGSTFSTMHNSQLAVGGAKIGPMIGAFVNYFHWERLSLQLEAGYIAKGGIYKQAFMDQSTQTQFVVKIDQTIHYINIPVCGNFYLSENNNHVNFAKPNSPNFYIQFGLYSNFLIAAQRETNSNAIDIPAPDGINSDSFRNADLFGIIGGVGFDIQHINMEIRSNLGLFNINADPRIPKTTNQTLQISAAAFF